MSGGDLWVATITLLIVIINNYFNCIQVGLIIRWILDNEILLYIFYLFLQSFTEAAAYLKRSPLIEQMLLEHRKLIHVDGKYQLLFCQIVLGTHIEKSLTCLGHKTLFKCLVMQLNTELFVVEKWTCWRWKHKKQPICWTDKSINSLFLFVGPLRWLWKWKRL